MLNLPQILDIPEAWIPMIDKVNDYRYFLLHSGRNSCKCLHPDTEILLFNGKTVKMKDVNVGDILRSPDNEPRVVLKKHCGFSDLYKVNQSKGVDYIVNENHLLSLKKRKSYCDYNRYKELDKIISMPVLEYRDTNNKFKEGFRGWKGESIEYFKRDVGIDPYYLGLWLGDGDKNILSITSVDNEIINYIEGYANKLELFFRKYKYKKSVGKYAITKSPRSKTNSLIQVFKSYNLLFNKHIPEDYLINDRNTRLELLAGLIDTDGTRPQNRGGIYYITQKSETLITQIKILADSLGFCTIIKKIYNKKYGKYYHVITIRGKVKEIPVRVERKKYTNSLKPYSDTSKLNIEYYGYGEYQGVEVDGDNLYMLPDRTVIHNSHSVARFILWLAEQSKLRIVCGREIQRSIEDSVHALLADLIREFNLNYEIGKATIEHRATGSTIRFVGLREQGVTSVKSMENISIAWVEEAQSITKQSLDILIPTIRNANAKVFFTMNRFRRNDPVFEQMVNRSDCLVLSANFDEIEPRYITKNVWNEAKESKERSEKDFEHVWHGQPLDETDNYLFTNTEIDDCQHPEFYHNEALYGHRIGAFDIARMGADRSAFVVIEQKGPMQWEEIYTEIWSKKDLAHTTGRIIDRISKFKLDISVVDGDGMGAGPRDIADFFLNAPKSIVEFRANKPSPDDINVKTGQRRIIRRHRDIKSWSCHQVKDMIENGWLKINHKDILTDMENIKYDFQPNGIRFIVSKEKMKLEGLKSPDVFDALMMAVSEIRNMAKVYDKKASNLPQYAVMDEAGTMLRNLPADCVMQ